MDCLGGGLTLIICDVIDTDPLQMAVHYLHYYHNSYLHSVRTLFRGCSLFV